MQLLTLYDVTLKKFRKWIFSKLYSAEKIFKWHYLDK